MFRVCGQMFLQTAKFINTHSEPSFCVYQPHNTSHSMCVTSSERIATACASEWHGKAVSNIIFNSVSPWKLPHSGRPAYSCQFVWECVILCMCVNLDFICTCNTVGKVFKSFNKIVLKIFMFLDAHINLLL